MASTKEILLESDKTMKRIVDELKGKLALQKEVLAHIEKYNNLEADNLSSQAACGPQLSRAEMAVKTRSEANRKQPKKKNQ